MAAIWLSSSKPWPQASRWVEALAQWLAPPLRAVFLGLGPDKLAHTAIYALLGALWVWPWWRRLQANGGRWFAGWQPWALAAGFGACDEIHQSFVPGRSCDAADWLADALGAAAAVWVWRSLARRQRE